MEYDDSSLVSYKTYVMEEEDSCAKPLGKHNTYYGISKWSRSANLHPLVKLIINLK